MDKVEDGLYEATCLVCGAKLQVEAITKILAMGKARHQAGWSFGKGKTGNVSRAYCKKHHRKRVGG